jgi:transposase-like protein
MGSLGDNSMQTECITTADSTKSRARGAHYAGVRPTPEQLDQLYNEQYLSSSEIAQRHGVSRKTVTNWLEQAGIQRRTGGDAALLFFLAQAEFVPPAEREDCVLDRAWEARPERHIRNKVVCRLCFRQVSRLTGKTAHLSMCHEGMTGDEYARVMPGHRHDCFQHTAGANGLDVAKLMDDWCTQWATADEIRNWRRDDPKLAQAKEYVGCLECGRKLFGGAEIQGHVWKIHDWTLEQYRERYPGAPTGSLDRRAMQADTSTERWHELKRLRALDITQQTQQKPRRARGAPVDTEKQKLFKRAAELYLTLRPALRSWPNVAKKLIPAEYAKNPKGAGDRLRQGAQKFLHIKCQTL